MESSVLLLSSRFHSRRCGICWPGCPPCPTGPAGYDLMVIWSPQRQPPPSFSSSFLTFLSPSQPPFFSRTLSLRCLVWCDQNSHGDVISVSQQVGASASSWVGVSVSWQAGKQFFHVTTAKAITSVFHWAGLSLCQHILIWLSLCKTDIAVIFKAFYSTCVLLASAFF